MFKIIKKEKIIMKYKSMPVLVLSAVLLTSEAYAEDVTTAYCEDTAPHEPSGKFRNSSAEEFAEKAAKTSEPKKRSGWEGCFDHDGDYHLIAKELADYVGEDNYNVCRAKSYGESEYVLEGTANSAR